MDMELQMLPLTEIIPYDNNPRIHKAGIEELKRSIQEFGFQNPIIVDTGHIIIAGHGRYIAARDLGMTEVPVIIASHLTAEQAQAYRIADNAIQEYSQWDMDRLSEEIRALERSGYDIEQTGISTKLLDSQIQEEAELPLDMDEYVTTPPKYKPCWFVIRARLEDYPSIKKQIDEYLMGLDDAVLETSEE